MAVTVAELRAIITADDTQYQQRMAAVLATSQRAQSQALSMVNVFDQLGPSLLKAGAAMTALTAPFDLFIKAGLDINQTLVEIRNNTILTDKEAEQMRATILKLASESPAKIEDIGQAYFRLTNFGLRGADATVALEAALKSAVGTGAQVAKTAEALGIALHDFNLQANDAERVMGLLHNAAAAGNLTLEQMVTVTGKLFNVAGTLGLKLEDTVGTFAALTRAGLPAAQASTALTTALTKIVNPTQASAKELAKLSEITGIDLVKDFSLAGIQAKGLSGVIGDLAIATKGHEDSILKLVSAQRGGLALLGLTSQQTKDLLPILANLAQVQGEELTPIQDGWNRSMQQAGNQLDTLKNKVTVFAAEVTQNLGISAAPVFAAIGQAIDAVAAGWRALEGPQQAAILAFAGVSAALGPILIALGAIVTFLGGPLALALVAASAAIATFAAAYAGNWGGLRDQVNAVITDLTKLYQDHKAEIDLLVDGIKLALGLAAELWVSQAATVLDAIKTMTLAMRAFAGDYAAAWEIIQRDGKRQQEAIQKDNSALTTFIKVGWESLFTQLKNIWDGIGSLLSATWQAIKTAADFWWKEIKQAIIGPIQDVLDWFRAHASEFRTAFEMITNAAKIGLQVHSPPIAAIWVGMIGDAAVTSSGLVRKSSVQFGEAFSAISTFARQHLPGVVSTIVDLTGTIVKVIEDLGVKLPKVLEDIFGKASTKGGAGTTAAGKAGGLLGQEFVQKFSLALEATKTLAAAANAPNLVSGAITGGLSGAIAGAMIGSIFGPAGTVVGLIAGGIAGIFGGLWRSPLQKAQEAAALQQAKDAIKLSMDTVLKSAQEVIQSGITTFNKAIEFFGNLDEFTRVRKQKFKDFFANLSRLMDYFMELAKKFAGQSMAQLKEVAETIGPIVNAIAAVPGAFEAINGHFGVAQASIDRFFADFDKVMTAFFARSEIWIDGISKRAMKVADRLTPVVALISSFGTALTDIGNVKEPDESVWGIFDRTIESIVTHVSALADKFDKAVLKVMANFSDKAGSALTLWKDAISSIKDMVDIPMPSDQDFANVFNGIEKIINGMTALADKLNTDSLAKAEAIANASLAIFAAIKAGVESLSALRDFKDVLTDTFTAFFNDFNAAVDMLTQMAGRAIQFDTVAKSFDQYISSGAATLSHAFTMLSQIITAAGGFFPGGAPVVVSASSVTASSAPASATSGSMAPMSAASAGGATFVLHIKGDDPRTQAAVRAFEAIFGAATLSGTSSQFA